MTTDQMAELAHETNRAYCRILGDTSQVPWAEAPEWQRASAIQGIEKALAGATPAELHESWLADKRAHGWSYGPIKDADAKTHPCFVPYDQLPPEQRLKDALFSAVVRAAATNVAEPVAVG